jgi:hypothetical protein
MKKTTFLVKASVYFILSCLLSLETYVGEICYQMLGIKLNIFQALKALIFLMC